MNILLASMFKFVANEGGDTLDRAVPEHDDAVRVDALVVVQLVQEGVELNGLTLAVGLHIAVEVATAVAVAVLVAVEDVEERLPRVEPGIDQRR